MSTGKSPKYSLDVEDIWEVGKTAAFVGVAAALTWLGSNLAEIDFGQWGPLVVPVAAVAIDGVVKWLKDNAEEE